MKTKVLPPRKGMIDPKAGTLYRSTGNGTIVLCTNEEGRDVGTFSGVCLHKGESGCYKSEYSMDWSRELFTEFEGKLMIEND